MKTTWVKSQPTYIHRSVTSRMPHLIADLPDLAQSVLQIAGFQTQSHCLGPHVLVRDNLRQTGLNAQEDFFTHFFGLEVCLGEIFLHLGEEGVHCEINYFDGASADDCGCGLGIDEQVSRESDLHLGNRCPCKPPPGTGR